MIRTGAYQHHWIPHSDHHVHFNSNDHHHNLHHNNYKHNNHDHGDRCWPERPAPLLLQTANHLPRIGPEQIIEDSVNGDNDDIDDSDNDDDHLLRTVSTQAQNPVQVKLNPLWRKRLKSEGKGFKFLFNFLGNFSEQSQRWNICLQSRIQGMRVISGYLLLHISSSKGTGMQQRPNYETSEVKEAPR